MQGDEQHEALMANCCMDNSYSIQIMILKKLRREN